MEKNKYIGLSIGIDPSLCESGVVGTRNGKIVFSHLVKSKKSGETPILETERLRTIVDEIIFLLDKHKPAVVIMESIAFMARNTTALAQLCGINYMLRDAIYKKYTLYMVTPTGLKKFVTGKGNCHKEMMLLETYKKFNVSFNNNNSCDAYCLAKIGDALINKDLKLTKPQSEVVESLKKQYG